MCPKYLELLYYNYSLLGVLCAAAVLQVVRATISVASNVLCHCLVVTTANGTPPATIPHSTKFGITVSALSLRRYDFSVNSTCCGHACNELRTFQQL